MAVEVTAGTPLAEALQNVVQPKVVEVGWSTGAQDDSYLSEYIILMLVNGKTQDQIAAELANDLLGLGEDDPSAVEFSRWLFEQVNSLHAQLNGHSAPMQGQAIQSQIGTTQEEQPQGPDASAQVQAQDASMTDGGDVLPEGAMYVQAKSQLLSLTKTDMF